LPGLDEEYQEESDLHVPYLIKRAERYLQQRMLEDTIEEAEDLVNEYKLEEASQIINLDLPFSENLDQYFQTVQQIEEEGIQRPKLLMKPWLREGETNFIYADVGVGKSLLALLIGYLVGIADPDDPDCDIGEWQVKNQTGALYLDGELGKVEMLDRIKSFSWLGKQQEDLQMRIFSIPEYQIKSGKDFNLAKREKQQMIVSLLKDNPKFKLVIIDSVSTVFGLENENDNSEWNNKVNPFLKDLRALGVAHIIQHHAGKDGNLRGASAMKAMAHNIIRLKDHPYKELGEAWFTIDNRDKQRSSGQSFKPFAINFIQDGKDTYWEITDLGTGKGKSRRKSKYFKILRDVIKGGKNIDLAEKYGCKPQYISQCKEKGRKDGYLDESNKPTQAGLDLLEKDDKDN
jgi:putative DNA primase/helicase